MVLLERLFAVYYYYFVMQRNFFRRKKLKFLVDRSEGDGALVLLSTGQFLCFMLILSIIKKKLDVIISGSSFAFGILGFYALLTFLQYLYFLRNRVRRRRILDEFLSLNNEKKISWRILGASIIIIPLILTPYLLTK
jgi:uncharacterized membrane protein YbhN (UPF0104 family)